MAWHEAVILYICFGHVLGWTFVKLGQGFGIF